MYCTFTSILAVGAILAAGASAAVPTNDWPQYRGPSRNGISLEAGWSWKWGTNGPPVLWRASVGNGFSSFAVANDRVFTMGNTDDVDSVFCFDAVTGKLLWRHQYPCSAQPLSYEGGPGSTPSVDGARVYTFSKSGDLFCLEAKTGRVIWQIKFELWPYREGDWRNTWRYAGSPLVMGPRLYLSIGQAGMALDKATGERIWESTPGHPGYSSPVPFTAATGPALAFFSGHAVQGVEAATGRSLWQIPWQTLWDLNAADPIISAEKIFVSSGNGVGGALFDLSAQPPRELWRNKNLKLLMNSAVLWQGLLYGFNDTDLACVDWNTGEERWRTRELRKGSVILAGGKLLLLSETGKFVVAEPSPASFQPLAEARVLGGRCWTTPALANGRLYLRNAVGDVVCLDLHAAPSPPGQ